MVLLAKWRVVFFSFKRQKVFDSFLIDFQKNKPVQIVAQAYFEEKYLLFFTKINESMLHRWIL
jgi:hypothetical protein